MAACPKGKARDGERGLRLFSAVTLQQNQIAGKLETANLSKVSVI
jgi:hypothetical protein